MNSCTEKMAFFNLVEGYKKINEYYVKAVTRSKRCEYASSKYNQKAIRDNIIKNKEIIFGVDNSICIK